MLNIVEQARLMNSVYGMNFMQTFYWSESARERLLIEKRGNGVLRKNQVSFGEMFYIGAMFAFMVIG